MTKLDLPRVLSPNQWTRSHLFLIPNQIKTLEITRRAEAEQAEHGRGRGDPGPSLATIPQRRPEGRQSTYRYCWMADVPPKLRSEPGLSLPCHGQRGKPRCFAWFTIAIIVKSFDRRDTANSALYASGFALNTHPSMNEHEHVHPDISRMLLTEYDTNLVDLPYDVTGSMTLTLRRAFNTTTLPDSLRIDQLANLADECEGAISRSKKSMPPTQLGLIRLSECGENDGASHLVASMMALNRLESAIRRTVSGDQPAKQGSAPLKDLIERLYEMEAKGSSSTSLAPVLRTLLLPTKSGGINLRNLVLHGFQSRRVVFARSDNIEHTRRSCADENEWQPKKQWCRVFRHEIPEYENPRRKRTVHPSIAHRTAQTGVPSEGICSNVSPRIASFPSSQLGTHDI